MLIRGILPDIEEKAGRVVRVGGGIEVSSLLAASVKEQALVKTSMRAVGSQWVMMGTAQHIGQTGGQ